MASLAPFLGRSAVPSCSIALHGPSVCVRAPSYPNHCTIPSYVVSDTFHCRCRPPCPQMFLRQLVDSLGVLRDAAIIHCDLKPENVLLKSPQVRPRPRLVLHVLRLWVGGPSMCRLMARCARRF